MHTIQLSVEVVNTLIEYTFHQTHQQFLEITLKKLRQAGFTWAWILGRKHWKLSTQAPTENKREKKEEKGCT